MILGTACSVASIIMGEIAERNVNLTQVRPQYYVVVGNGSAWLVKQNITMHLIC